MLARWKEKARSIKKETYVLYLACRDPRTPWYVKIFAVCVVGYAFSPIDLIPDFIPVIGLLDDVILIPLGITLAIRFVPPIVLKDCRQRADEEMSLSQPVNRYAAVIVITVWILLAAAGAIIAWRFLSK